MRRETIFFRSIVAASIFALASALAAAQSPAPEQSPDSMPITTSSPEAKALFQQGVIAWEDLHIPRAIELWQTAIEKDPNFLMAHLYIGDLVPDPDRRASELKKVSAQMDFVTPDERLMAEWIIDGSRDDTIGAMAALNTLLPRYPRDKHLYWFAALAVGDYYHQWERAGELAEQAVQVDPDFAGALNNLGYDYAFQGKYEKAFPVMQHYIEVLPGEPNPQDSYAEILRMAGRFAEAVEHYHAALKIEPNFSESLLGLADTYALMGDQDKARAQYKIAIQHAYTKTYAVEWQLRSAATYLREKRFTDADTAFQAVAQTAHQNSCGIMESESYRLMALYQHDDGAAMRWLRKAREVLDHPHETSLRDRQQELALIDRTAIHRAIQSGRLSTAAVILARLNNLAKGSSNPNVERTYHAAAGMVLAAQHKWLESIPHLEEDTHDPIDPFSAKLLVVVYRKAGFSAQSDRMARQLAALNDPTVGQALVVPDFRAGRRCMGPQPRHDPTSFRGTDCSEELPTTN